MFEVGKVESVENDLNYIGGDFGGFPSLIFFVVLFFCFENV